MTKKNLLKILSITVAAMTVAGNASAYHYKTHALSAKLAAELVKRFDAAKKRYAEIYLSIFVLQLGTGAWEEDNGNFDGNNRAMRHYYDPDCQDTKKGVPYYSHYEWWKTLEKGTDVTKPPGGRYAGALEWARNGAVEKWSNANPFNWEGAIRAYDYTASSRAEAYYRLGHVLHLLTDMAEPDHALNMPHAGSSKGLPDTIDEIIGQSMADAIMDDIKNMRVSQESQDKIAWLLYATRIKQLAFKTRSLGYELLVDDFIHPDFVEEFFQGKDAIHMISSKTTADTLPPIQGQQVPSFNKFDDFFNTLAKLSKSAVSDRNKYPIPLGISELGNYFSPKELFYPKQPIYLIPAIDMSDETEKQKYYSLAWELLEKATEYNANLLMHFFDIVNPPPYVKEVTVIQDGKAKYWANWEDIYGQPGENLNSTDPHLSYNIVKKRELKNMANKGVMHGKEATINIKFGPDIGVPENIDKGSVKVTIGGKPVQVSIKNREEPHIWEGTFIVPKLKEYEDEKTMQISISASDADMHWTVGPIPGSTLDSDPLTPVKVLYEGSDRFRWVNHESVTASEKWDTNHKIRVVKEEEISPFEFTITSVSKSKSGLYAGYWWIHTGLFSDKSLQIHIFEKEQWAIDPNDPKWSGYSRIRQGNGYYEGWSASGWTSLEIPPAGKMKYSKHDGEYYRLNLFAIDEDGGYKYVYVWSNGDRINAHGPSYNTDRDPIILRWKYRGEGKDGKIYESEVTFDPKEWIPDREDDTSVFYRRKEETRQ